MVRASFYGVVRLLNKADSSAWGIVVEAFLVAELRKAGGGNLAAREYLLYGALA